MMIIAMIIPLAPLIVMITKYNRQEALDTERAVVRAELREHNTIDSRIAQVYYRQARYIYIYNMEPLH